jgi:hypothetical protein
MSKKVRICPRCQSTNVSPDMRFGKGLFCNSYNCDECGFNGEFFPEVDKEIIDKIKR